MESVLEITNVGENWKRWDDSKITVILKGARDSPKNGFFTTEKWIDELNRKDGKKYMMLEKVSDVTAADLILARYTKKDKASSETNSRVATTAS